MPFVTRLLEENGLVDVEYAEPYAGGASVALTLLFEEYAARIHINDLSRAVYAFWHSVLNEPERLCHRIEQTEITMEEWHRQREVYRARETADLLDLGFATFFLNRTNRSGIISGGVIGGQKQNGAWGIAARFGKSELIQRIRKIARYRNRICLHQMDALDFTVSIAPTLKGNTFLFYDPPYIETENRCLYLDNYSVEDHRTLAERIVQLEHPWIVIYDHAAVQYELYRTQRRMMYGLAYTAQDRYQGREVVFFSDRLWLPVLEKLAARRMHADAAASRL